MKFLIQKINKEIRHDFSFVLLEAVHFHNWLHDSKIKIKYLNTDNEQTNFVFKISHKKYVPVGSVEFVSAHLQQFYNLTPKPQNVPETLFPYAGRYIFNSDEKKIYDDLVSGREYIIKSNDKIKTYFESYVMGEKLNLPPGNYQVSERISIDSEWRAFVYDNKLVGLQNYSGIFTIFPDIKILKQIIEKYSKIAPIAYTLDVGICEDDNIPDVIEIHDFFSCGLYGFSDLSIYQYMLHKWYCNYVKLYKNN